MAALFVDEIFELVERLQKQGHWKKWDDGGFLTVFLNRSLNTEDVVAIRQLSETGIKRCIESKSAPSRLSKTSTTAKNPNSTSVFSD